MPPAVKMSETVRKQRRVDEGVVLSACRLLLGSGDEKAFRAVQRITGGERGGVRDPWERKR